MNYELMIPPFEFDEFKDFKKKQTQQYFEWYISQIGSRIEILKRYLQEYGKNIELDYSPASLIPLWRWYEDEIILEEKTVEEIQWEVNRYPKWLRDEVPTTKVSLETYKFGMDIAIYFAETIIKNSSGKIEWGFFTKPKIRMSVNQPVLLGFKNQMDLNPRLVVVNCTNRSVQERDEKRLFEIFNTWQEFI